MMEVMATFTNEKENLNFKLDDRDVRALVADLFGEVKTFYPWQDGKQVAMFLNISKKRPDETRNDTWKSMEISCVMNGWVLREKNVNPPSLQQIGRCLHRRQWSCDTTQDQSSNNRVFAQIISG